MIESLSVENLKIESSTQIAEEFGKYFSQIGKSFANKIDKPVKTGLEYTNKIDRNRKTIYFNPTNKDEIEKLIDSLPNKISSGHDSISNVLLKKVKETISRPLAYLFNESMLDGQVPDIMKIADVIPLHKSKSKTETNNYRPISLLITISKVLEKVIYNRTYKFLENTEQIFKSKYSFRSKHSCELAVSELLSEIIKNNEIGLHTIAVYLDLSKAFDTIDHKLLLIKLERYGICGVALQWFESYLSNRWMRAKCITHDRVSYSKLYDMEYGTPQGSCLGPLLFLIFTNDWHLHLRHCLCILFADDTTLYLSHRNLHYCEWCIQSDLAILQNWFRANKLTLNISKSVCMHYTIKESKPIKIVIDNTPLPMVTRTKFLGIWIDNHLSWQSHFDQLCLKIIRHTTLLRISKNHLNTLTKKILYYAHIYSHLVYGCTTWGNMLKKELLAKLQKLQN